MSQQATHGDEHAQYDRDGLLDVPVRHQHLPQRSRAGLVLRALWPDCIDAGLFGVHFFHARSPIYG
jgi:hypothetical protein